MTGEEILPYDQNRVVEQARFSYSRVGKAFEKQIKIIGNQRRKQVEALEVLKPEKNLKSIEGIFQKRWILIKLKM